MVDCIYIPTYKRQGKQHTFDGLPDKWKKKAVLVVHPDEEHEGYPTLECPIQGKGIAGVRKWIAEHAGDTRYGVLDDDIIFCSTIENQRPGNQKLTAKQFNNLIDEVNEAMDDGFIHVACEVTWNPPLWHIDHHINFRITNNIFYDGSKLPVEELDWESIPFAEDYYINLQLLTRGYQNKVFLRYRTNTIAPTGAEGGCSEFRNIKNHNRSMRKLQKAFPQFVTLREKVQKTGPWKGQAKLAALIQWKKAYKSFTDI